MNVINESGRRFDWRGKNQLCFSTFFYVVAINANRSTFYSHKNIIIFLNPENLKLILIFIVLDLISFEKKYSFRN